MAMSIEKKRHIALAVLFIYLAIYYIVIWNGIEPFSSHTRTVGLFGNLIALSMFYIGIESC